MIRSSSLIIAVAMATGGCFDPIPQGPSTITGTYTLQTVNGAALPTTKPGTNVEILNDTITIYGPGNYAHYGNSRTTVNGQATTSRTSMTGTWGALGTSVTFVPVSGTQRVALVEGTTMTFVEAGVTSVYRK